VSAVECFTCGTPTWRPEHAEWCSDRRLEAGLERLLHEIVTGSPVGPTSGGESLPAPFESVNAGGIPAKGRAASRWQPRNPAAAYPAGYLEACEVVGIDPDTEAARHSRAVWDAVRPPEVRP